MKEMESVVFRWRYRSREVKAFWLEMGRQRETPDRRRRRVEMLGEGGDAENGRQGREGRGDALRRP